MDTSSHEELKKAKRQAALLYEVSRAIVSNRYAEEILLLIVGLTAQLTGSKICSLMLLDEESQELVIKATQSLSETYRTKPPLKVGESVSGKAVKEKTPITIRDVTHEPSYKYPDIARKEGLKSLASVPMMIKDRVIGVLNCYTSEERDFSRDEMDILMGVANQAAVALENTRLLAERVRVIEQLEARKKIERAKGILMKAHRLTEQEAYRLMQKQSMQRRMGLKEIAEAILLAEDLKN